MKDMMLNRGPNKTKELLKDHPVSHLINNIHWDIFERILELTESTAYQFLQWLESLDHDDISPCLGQEYLDKYVFISLPSWQDDQEVTKGPSSRYIWVPVNFMGKGIMIEDVWDLYRNSVTFRTKLTEKYKEKYGL